MDYSYPYIVSLTREPFLFYEMRSTAKLMSEGLSDEAIANASTGERVTLDKKQTDIDLDDGAKKNYAIFRDVLAKIK